MAEIVGFAASTITLLTTAFDAYQTLYGSLENFRNASACIESLRQDIDDISIVLGGLKGLLGDEETRIGVSRSGASESLTNVLNNCVKTASHLEVMIREFLPTSIDHKPSHWQRAMWVVKKQVVEGYRRDLREQKMTLNLVLAVASWSNINSLRASASEFTTFCRQLQEKLPKIIGDNRPALSERQELRTHVQEDFSLPLNRYLNTAASFISSTRRHDPSLQISSLGVTINTSTTSFKTAPSRRSSSSPAKASPASLIRLHVTNAGRDKVVELELNLDDTIETAQTKIRQIIGFPTATFHLMYGKVVLDQHTRSVGDYSIPSDAILRCVFFRPDDTIPIASINDIFIISVDIVDNLFGLLSRTTIKVDIGDSVREIKVKYAKHMMEDKDRLVFIYSGRKLEDSTLMISDIFTMSDNARYVIHLMRIQLPSFRVGVDTLSVPISASENLEQSKVAGLFRDAGGRNPSRGTARETRTSIYVRGLKGRFRPMKLWNDSVISGNLNPGPD